ncbi:MAG: hypothetical protein MJB14_00870 [Spirochaetes bacterium]|nr:hypothetical protein [Spirochaetota bacterium]
MFKLVRFLMAPAFLLLICCGTKEYASNVQIDNKSDKYLDLKVNYITKKDTVQESHYKDSYSNNTGNQNYQDGYDEGYSCGYTDGKHETSINDSPSNSDTDFVNGFNAGYSDGMKDGEFDREEEGEIGNSVTVTNKDCFLKPDESEEFSITVFDYNYDDVDITNVEVSLKITAVDDDSRIIYFEEAYTIADKTDFTIIID